MTFAYFQRHLRVMPLAYLQQFPIVLLLRARQVGKTTILRHELRGFAPFDLEDAGTADGIVTDPVLFLRDHSGRVWFDEAHRVTVSSPSN
ncbi:MAG: hypothetical protein HY713_14465 [candidate division NC10 bacterium]|nr:hypothetical protein [candidate division NC10 bacterium]